MKQRFVQRYRPIVCVASALILCGAGGARAEEEEREAAERGEHEFHRHHLSVFLGATTGDVAIHGGEGEAETQSEGGGETETVTDASIGLDYEYRLNRTWGIGFLFDYVAGDARTSVAGIPVILHPVGTLELLAAPGLEHHEGENEFLVRLGVMYAFEVGRWSLKPAFNVDFVDGDQVYIYGLYIGRGF